MKNNFVSQIVTSFIIFLLFVGIGTTVNSYRFSSRDGLAGKFVLADSTLPDLVVTGIKFYQPQTTNEVTPQAGQRVTAFAVMTNTGGSATGVFNVKWFQNGSQVGYGSHSSIAPGETSQGNVRYDFTVPDSQFTLMFQADSDNFITEQSKSNNSYTITVTPGGASSLPDLAVTGIKLYRPQTTQEFIPNPGDRATAFGVMTNIGGQSTGYFNVKWFYNGTQSGYGSHSPVAPGETSQGNVRFDFTVVSGQNTLTFQADSDNFITEQSKANNSYTLTFNATTPTQPTQQQTTTPSTTPTTTPTTTTTAPIPQIGTQVQITQPITVKPPSPTLSLDLIAPKGGEYLGTINDLHWNATGPEGTKINLFYSNDGGESWKEIATNVSNTGIYRWDTHGLGEGSNYKIMIEAKSGNNVLRRTSDNIVIDHTPPLDFNLGSPADAENVSSTPILAWKTTSDNLSGIAHYSVSIDYKVIADKLTDPKFEVPTNPVLSSGLHSWYVVAYDKAGNPKPSTIRTFTVSLKSSNASSTTAPIVFGQEVLILKPISVTIEQAKVANTEVKNLVQNTQPLGNAVAGGGVAIGLLSMVAGFSQHAAFPLLRGFSAADFMALPHRIIALFLGLAGRKRREEKPWGVIYDAVTKLPVDPVIVTLCEEGGREIDSKITDYDGRFGFLVGAGTYALQVKKTHYSFPSTLVPGSSDEFYPNLYHGEKITVEKNSVINVNVPIDPIGFDWNQVIKPNYIGKVVQQGFLRFGDIFFYIGFLIAIVWTMYEPTLTNLVFLILFVSIFGLRFWIFKPSSYGIIRQQATKLPYPFALIKVFSKEAGIRVASTISDHMGRYFLLMPYPGVYFYTVEVKEAMYGPYREIYRSSTMPILSKDTAVLNETIDV